MKYTLIIIGFVVAIISCNEKYSNDFSGQDKNGVLALNELYRNDWLANDSMSVVDLFTDDAALIPPNNKGDIIRGKKAIGNYWFPVKDTSYVITLFEMTDQAVIGSDDVAVLEGVSKVGWNTETNGRILSSSSSVTNFITVCRKIDNKWKIYRQIWNVQ